MSQKNWTPDEGQLKQLAHYLNDSLSGRDPNVRQKAELELKKAKTSPDIDNYLCFLVTSQISPQTLTIGQDGFHAARSAAAIMLKNDIKTHYKLIPQPNQEYVRQNILFGLQDTNAQIRGYIGNVVTELVRQAGVLGWPEIMPSLISMIQNDGGSVPPQAQDGAMSALLKVCEDNKKALAKTYQSERPLDFLIPKLLEFTTSSDAKIRANALAAINQFLPQKPDVIVNGIDGVLQQLFKLTNDSSDLVRKQICRAIVLITEISPERLVPHMQGLVDYFIVQQRNVDDSELALDAAEFWLCVAEDDKLKESLFPHLHTIVPVLLESMVYSEDDVLRLEGEDEDDADKEDRDQDIKPQFAVVRDVRNNGVENGASQSGTLKQFDEEEELSEGEFVEYDTDDQEDDPEDQWNLRKCSAAALDVLASTFHQPVFEATLPYLQANLKSSEWPNREAAVLAIGAIAEGCIEVVEPHLPDLIPFLINLCQDDQPVVRKISCWSLGRYSSWAASLDEAKLEQFFVPIMDGILKRMLDNNKKVQEAAASAFANLEEKSGQVLLDHSAYCKVIAEQFAECFKKYKDRNMFILYDCVQTLAERVGPKLSDSGLVHSLMPAILGRWESVNDQSREIFPLHECLSYVATSLGVTFEPYAEPIFKRCVRIICQNLDQSLYAASNQATIAPDKDFLVTSLDLLGAVIQALGQEKSVVLIRTIQQPTVFELMHHCLEDSGLEVRQSAYALLGDCAIHIFPELQPSLPRVLPILIAQLQLVSTSYHDQDFAVHNNACWSCGEISVRAREAMAPYVEALLGRYYNILSSDETSQSLQENASIALGRLGLGCADLLAPHLAHFAPSFLTNMKNISYTQEKIEAMHGISEVVLRNPQGLEQCLIDFVYEISMANPSTHSLLRVEEGGPCGLFQKNMMLTQHANAIQILEMYQNMIPNFASTLDQQLPPEPRQMLKELYNV